ncbi:hypothetical protein PsorP6_006404 [Peronosclerospora sorghi]|uniref:Uncharacterized protein n=1 Tax=Peronosclerospora sorghi TaxID=230839 RepID=A0ACC0W6K5_9STRA|nr:hypothetical protein PsorP6_006404 [Peronosclerospora sorghi]
MPEHVASQTPAPRTPASSSTSTTCTPRLFVPNDNLLTASYLLIGDAGSTDDERYFKGRSPHVDRYPNVVPDEILQSFAGDSKPETWRTNKASLQNFERIRNQGISFLCTPDAALYSLGGLQLTLRGTSVTIRNYSRYDKLYYVDLTCIPRDVLYCAIYNYFVAKDALPVLFTPTYVAGELNSRDRTVYFSSVNYPRDYSCRAVNLFERFNSIPMRSHAFLAKASQVQPRCTSVASTLIYFSQDECGC